MTNCLYLIKIYSFYFTGDGKNMYVNRRAEESKIE